MLIIHESDKPICICTKGLGLHKLCLVTVPYHKSNQFKNEHEITKLG